MSRGCWAWHAPTYPIRAFRAYSSPFWAFTSLLKSFQAFLSVIECSRTIWALLNPSHHGHAHRVPRAPVVCTSYAYHTARSMSSIVQAGTACIMLHLCEVSVLPAMHDVYGRRLHRALVPCLGEFEWLFGRCARLCTRMVGRPPCHAPLLVHIGCLKSVGAWHWCASAGAHGLCV